MYWEQCTICHQYWESSSWFVNFIPLYILCHLVLQVNESKYVFENTVTRNPHCTSDSSCEPNINKQTQMPRSCFQKFWVIWAEMWIIRQYIFEIFPDDSNVQAAEDNWFSGSMSHGNWWLRWMKYRTIPWNNGNKVRGNLVLNSDLRKQQQPRKSADRVWRMLLLGFGLRTHGASL